MIPLIFLLLILSNFFSAYIKENKPLILALGVFFSTLSISFYDAFWAKGILSGAVGFSFLYVVLLFTVLPYHYKLKRKLSQVQNTFFLLGFIFIIPHMYSNLIESLQYSVPIDLFGVVAFLLLVLLSISVLYSKRQTRRSYSLLSVVYIFIFLHLIFISNISHASIFILLLVPIIFYFTYIHSSKHKTTKAITITLLFGSLGGFFLYQENNTMKDTVDIIANNELKDGLYIGKATGFRGIPTEVRLLIYNNEIEYIIIDQCGCTDQVHDGYYADIAFEISNEIQFENRTDIDIVSGASITSYSVRAAVINALEQALKEE
jgi:uncharacterized protein with FMN-binding domain